MLSIQTRDGLPYTDAKFSNPDGCRTEMVISYPGGGLVPEGSKERTLSHGA
jgi:hypothetical protein